MQIDGQKRLQFRTGKKAGIWLALFFALGLHGMALFLPVTKQTAKNEKHGGSIELQLTTFSQQSPILLPPETEPDFTVPEAEPEPEPELTDDVLEPLQERQAMVQPEVAQPPSLTTSVFSRPVQRDLDDMSGPEIEQLTATVLARQFFTGESAADRLFGKPLPQHSTELRQEFHYPMRPNMIDMLDQPMPELPFAYTPDLIYFAYDPGLKGDIQRFWDVITPEFGWRTKYGTEVRCIWVLVIVGCGWK